MVLVVRFVRNIKRDHRLRTEKRTALSATFGRKACNSQNSDLLRVGLGIGPVSTDSTSILAEGGSTTVACWQLSNVPQKWL